MNQKIPEAKPLFLERMQKLLPDKSDYKKYLEILKITPVKSIRCNALKISPEELKKKLEYKEWKISQIWKEYPEVMIVEGKLPTHSGSQINKEISNEKNSSVNNIDDNNNNNNNGNGNGKSNSSKKSSLLTTSSGVVVGDVADLEPGELGRAFEHLLGYYYIQELASMLPVMALNPKKEELILDLCAAPGSKTTQIAAQIQNTGAIIANEISLGRIKILASNLERCGVTNTIITKKEGSALCNQLKKEKIFFDKILVDVPCSGEGTLRSSYKTYSMWNIKTIKNLPKIQENLFLSAFSVLKNRGKIIYSTCTHAPEENEGVVNSILSKLGNKIKLEKINLPIKFREGITEWEDKKFSKEVKKCARIYPQDNNTEGFFIAKFKKVK